MTETLVKIRGRAIRELHQAGVSYPEMALLHVTDYDPETKTLVVPSRLWRGRHQPPRTFHLSISVADAVSTWIAVRGATAPDNMFVQIVQNQILIIRGPTGRYCLPLAIDGFAALSKR